MLCRGVQPGPRTRARRGERLRSSDRTTPHGAGEPGTPSKGRGEAEHLNNWRGGKIRQVLSTFSEFGCLRAAVEGTPVLAKTLKRGAIVTTLSEASGGARTGDGHTTSTQNGNCSTVADRSGLVCRRRRKDRHRVIDCGYPPCAPPPRCGRGGPAGVTVTTRFVMTADGAAKPACRRNTGAGEAIFRVAWERACPMSALLTWSDGQHSRRSTASY